MGLLRGTSIKERLLRIGLLTTAAALIAAVVVISIRDFVIFRNSLLRSLAVEAMIVGANSTAALTFRNHKDAEETLGALRNSPNIVFARVTNKDGEIFADYRRDQEAAIPQPPADLGRDGHVFQFDRVTLSRPILIGQEFLGTIVIQADLGEFYSRLLTVNGSAVLIIIITLSIAALLLERRQRSITDPIRELTGLMQTVSQRRDFSVRATTPGTDELGALAAGFNDMLAQIRKRDAELEMHRTHLEKMVVERTAELARTNVDLERELRVREQAEAALRTGEERYRKISQEFHALLDAIPDGLTLLSPRLEVLWANRGAAEGMKKETDSIVGRCHQLWHGRATPCDGCPVERSFRSGEKESSIVPAADERLLDVRTVPLKDPEGTVSSVIEVTRDITEQRRLEEQLRHAQKIEAVGQLAGGVAHDFNNILSAILGCADLLQMRLRKEDALQRYVQQIVASSQKAAELTHGLLAFSRKQIINTKPVDLNLVVLGVEKLIATLITEDIELSIRPAHRQLAILADWNQIEQILINLATNARDAMPEGGRLSVSTSLRTIDEDFIKAHGYGSVGPFAVISVADSGQGMDAVTRSRIFEPFFTTKDVGKGTGLGLAIVFGIVKQHGGYIVCSSEPGRGTTFDIYLPLTGEEVRPAEPAGLPAVRGGAETILVAEDDEHVRSLAIEVLTHHGYTVLAAPDGERAIEVFREYQGPIDLLVLDVIMPRKNGREVHDAILALQPGIKAIFTSGYTAEVIHQKGILDAAVNFIYKPVAPKVLLRKVREVLDGNRPGAG